MADFFVLDLFHSNAAPRQLDTLLASGNAGSRWAAQVGVPRSSILLNN